MGFPVMILGESGTGKSTSMRNLNPERTLLIQTVRKPLPFRSKEWKAWDGANKKGSIFVTDKWDSMITIFKRAPGYGKDIVVIDDFQYLLANEFMRRTHEKGFDKFTEIGHHAWSVLMEAQDIGYDTRFYFLSHTQTDENGNTKAKTIGKLLDDKITIEGLFTIVLRTMKNDQGYFFSTQNNGSDTVKSPMGLFPNCPIENDLAMIDNEICEYYGIKIQNNAENAA